MLRFIIAIIFVILFLILSLPIQGLFWLLGKNEKWKHGIDIASLRIVQWAFRVLSFIAGVKLVETGRENIPKDWNGVRSSLLMLRKRCNAFLLRQ